MTKPQTPAKGVMMTGRWSNAVCYHVECECADPDHAVKTWIEVNGDPEVEHVDLSFYVNTTTPVWRASRWRAVWNLLTHGYHEAQHTLILDQQAAINLAAAIQDSVRDLSAHGNKTSKL